MITTHSTTLEHMPVSSRSGIADSLDHRSGRRSPGRPVASYRRGERVTPRPNYLARRIGALGATALAMLAVVQIAAAAISFVGASPAFADGDATAPASTPASTRTHVARDGDSLWSIAAQYRGDTPRAAYIDRLIELNGGTLIHVGQSVLLP